MKGKAYANRKPLELRPKGDFYETPRSLVWRLIDTGEIEGYGAIIDPCAGEHAIVDELKKSDKIQSEVFASELYTHMYSANSLQKDIYDIEPGSFDVVVTNFPFSEWDDMVRKSLEIAPKVITIGRVNYFGTHQRNVSGLWDSLTKVYVFDRMVDYRSFPREDGAFCVGAIVTGWFVFERGSAEIKPTIEIMDVQQYATLGAYKK